MSEECEDLAASQSLLIDKKQPFIITGGDFTDDRGMLRFFNNFSFAGINRFYCIEHETINMIRAWHGHHREGKVFLVNSGTMLIGAASMSTDKVEKFVLSSKGSSQMLWIPPGFANGFMNLTEKATVTIFSTSTTEQSSNDDIRFPFDKWNIWQPNYR